MLRAMVALIRMETRRLWRQRRDMAASLAFILLVMTLFPFVLGPDGTLLQNLAPGLMTIALLFGLAQEAGKSFAEDRQAGVIDGLHAARFPLALYALVHVGLRHVALTALFIALLPLLCILLQVPFEKLGSMTLAYGFGGMTLALMGMMASALTLGARRAGILLPLLLFPLQIPVLLFTTQLAASGLNAAGLQAFYFLAALFVVSFCLFPFLAGLALRSAVEST